MKRLAALLLLTLALGSTVTASERVRLVHSLSASGPPLMASSGAQSTPTPSANDVPCDGTVWTLDASLGAVQAVPLSRTVTTAGATVEGCVFVRMERGWVALWFKDEQPSAGMLSAPLESELVLARVKEA